MEPTQKFDRALFEDLLKRRFYVTPSFQIYGGIAGLYDYGPPGCAVLNNMIQVWRSFFIIEESMLEVDCTCLTPEDVLKASGHVARFNDLMVKDSVTGEFYRVDHLIKAILQERMKDPNMQTEQTTTYESILSHLDNYTEFELSYLLKKLDLKAPHTGNDLTQPEPFNLMFTTSIGPTGLIKGYLRPETAQGIFVNFKRLLDFNNQRMPFAVAQIGRAFRNEISPRSGVLRVREFTMAEVEYFVHPERKQHPKFARLAHLVLPLFSSKAQIEEGTGAAATPLGWAVVEGIIKNETLAYFMGRIYQYLLKIGIREDRLRFRQHAPNEMAHYASDCWDAEILTSYGWVECVGCADRSCYDLSCHAKAANVDLVVREDLAEPEVIEAVRLVLDKSLIGKTYRTKAKQLISLLESSTNMESREFGERLNREGRISITIDGEQIFLDNSMIRVESIQKRIHVHDYVPSVIEPSFGLGRILYALLEHRYFIRETDEQRAVLGLPAIVAPTKCIVLPLSNQAEFEPFLHELCRHFSYFYRFYIDFNYYFF